MQEEVWKDVKGYEGLYQVSNLGNVRSLDRHVWNKANNSFSMLKGRNLKQDCKDKLYKQIGLAKNGKYKKFLVHRLVAELFVLNPENKPQVNHIDENKLNNNYLNLEWVTSSENINHGKRNDTVSIKVKKQVKCIDKNGNETYYDSALDAEKNGFSRFCISLCCNNKIKTHKGFTWEFANTINKK